MEPRVQRVIAIVTEDFRREITPGELARSVNLSPSRLRHLFKSEMGVSLTSYVKAQRMLKAKELLETTFLNVNEVMLRVGLKDKSHFTRDFKKHYQLSPLKYRNKHLRKSKAVSGGQS